MHMVLEHNMVLVRSKSELGHSRLGLARCSKWVQEHSRLALLGHSKRGQVQHMDLGSRRFAF